MEPLEILRARHLAHAHQRQAEPSGEGRDTLRPVGIHDNKARTRVLQAVLELLRGPPGVHRYRDPAGQQRADESEHPLGVVAHGDGYAVAGLQPVTVPEPRGELPGDGQRLAIGIALAAHDHAILLAMPGHEAKVGAQIGRLPGVAAIAVSTDLGLFKLEGLPRRGQRGDRLLELRQAFHGAISSR